MTASPLAAAAGLRVVTCPLVLRPFVDAGVLAAVDVHVARTLCDLLPCEDDLVLLGAAMAARAPRVGHTALAVDRAADLAGFEVPGRDAVAVEAALSALSWPDPDAWLDSIARSPVAGPADAGLPLVVEDRVVALRRQYEQETRLWDDLRSRAAADGEGVSTVDEGRLTSTIGRLFPGSAADEPQVVVCRSAARRRLSVLTGGPGTGKTWTVARILAVLVDQAHAEGRDLRIALAAPTAKAAAQLSNGIESALGSMDVDDDVAAGIRAAGRGQTIHRLLGRKTASRFWHDASRPLPHDVVVVDETSMASLSLMTRLLEAIRPEARVVLIGDPDQLPSVEAGSVLADVVATLGAGVVTRLTVPHRYASDSGIAALASAIREGDGDAAVTELRTRPDLAWIEADVPSAAELQPIREALVDRGRRMRAAAISNDAVAARKCLEELVVLAPHRRGRWGVGGWNRRIDGWFAEDVDGWLPYEDIQPGRTILATTNDRSIDVYNGDLGVVVYTDEGARVAFHVDPDRLVAPSRLRGYELVHAMTIHKSQGSQWNRVILALPAEPSRALTQQLLYTAATRAAWSLTVIGDREVLTCGIERPIARASAMMSGRTP